MAEANRPLIRRNARKFLPVVLAFGLAAGALESCRSGSRAPAASPRVLLGIEVLAAEHPELLKGKTVGLITNPSGMDGNLESTVAVLRRLPGVKLAALYAPEHGVRGEAQAGEFVPYYFDAKYGLPVISLYGSSQKLSADMLQNIDKMMRDFDSSTEDKQVSAGAVRGLDALVFDIQDVGTRVYTYAATMAYAMQACAESGLDFIVLDRPNPIDGSDLEGPILEYPKYSSFIGLYPIPLRHGLTIGEMARLINERFLEKKARLTVVPMKGWTRGMYFEDTGLPWVTPSPNMPTVETAVVYPGQVLIEGTTVSEGRGTTHPFEWFGAPWIDGFEAAARLNALRLPGVVFREQWFTPTFSKFQGEKCGGCQLHVVDRAKYRPFATSLEIIAVLRSLAPEKFAFHDDYFDKVCGTSAVREALLKGIPPSEIVAGLEAGLRKFEALRRPFLLY